MKEIAVLDRIEGNHAVLLVGNSEKEKTIEKSLLPPGSREGTWFNVELSGDEILKITIDQKEAEEVQKRVRAKMAMLRRKK
ncbi:hypothetical protein AJ85_20685 [Alkalihalobacillus alcalophilus ATCC 27647 = CGMCC 1.3604]|uniref:DUF3006 domain-containing protein n=1 Tax=Alkalihalobacillus alcalophilus ATCC 27647 = CGMCC 1.3604 TaxID=1218173 RepID=A0A094YRA1_ALKAL|nr:DUF3006 domain-containing protein [Alkalihalobacillus alcalophilus]KGA96007.1 hypothetical protein BALCAV_0218955 [Alkalihalobacillus alcalophilus ATCC 27647 = CGMCC 1.3604]MED1562481.1 DUF3006 domain-containing protein [Alkalihalobacillus alcalophilus]THG88896.1 hypothetical protein AJ85_20685 [Alkalihalobacillus alcalophilus ATCC 27647 = CGMCC 1.3604]